MDDARFDSFPSPADYGRPITTKEDKTLGYLYFLDRDHPFGAPGTGRVYHHRHVASVALGRWLCPDEHVHHKDGCRTNNHPDNLEVTNASAHGLAHNPTTTPEIRKTCLTCRNTFLTQNHPQRYCSPDCGSKARRRFEISSDELERLVWAYPTTKVASMLGVSDAAVAKRCKKFNIKKPPRGYWAKRKSL